MSKTRNIIIIAIIMLAALVITTIVMKAPNEIVNTKEVIELNQESLNTNKTNTLNRELINAAYGGDIDKVKELVENGADVNALEENVLSVLMEAILGGHFDVVQFLVENGADVNVIPAKNTSHYFGTALTMASKEGYFDIVKFLVENDADVNTTTNGDIYSIAPYAGTALIVASREGHFDIVKFLVENGADVNAAANIGDLDCSGTALIVASSAGHFDIVKFLVESGADVNAVTAGEMENYTALIAAASIGNVDIAKFLVDNGADVNINVTDNFYSGTALIIASTEGYLDIVKYLVENDSDINFVANGDVYYGTPLMMASKEGNWDIVMFLIDNGADINATYQNGKTAQDYAIDHVYSQVPKYLETFLQFNPYVPKPLTATFTYFTQVEEVTDINTQVSKARGLLAKEGSWINDSGNYQQITEAPATHLEITITAAFEENKLIFDYSIEPQNEINDQETFYWQSFTEDLSNTDVYLIIPKEWRISQQFQVIDAIQNGNGSRYSFMACSLENSELSLLTRNYNAVLQGKYELIDSNESQLKTAVDIISEEDRNGMIEQLQEKYEGYQIYKIPYYIPESITEVYSYIGRTSTIYFDKSTMTNNGKIFIEIPQITFKPTEADATNKAVIEGLAYELDLSQDKTIYEPERIFTEESTSLKKKIIDLGDQINMEFVYIPAAEFIMGSPDVNLTATNYYSRPHHQVKFSKGFWMGIYEVTNSQYQQFVKESNYDGKRESNANFLRHILLTNFDSPYKGSDYPVIWISWDNAMAFCKWLSVKEGRTYRLPTEAEWEYSCRAGLDAPLDIKDDGLFISSSDGRATSQRTTHPAGQGTPNEYGLYDMYDNVREWCLDWFGPYSEDIQVDPKGPESGDRRVVRGDYSGSIISYSYTERSNRLPNEPSNEIGFRIVCEDSE